MKNALSYGFGFLLLLVFLASVCSAEQAPSVIVQIHGGESTIANDTDGMAIITVKDVNSTVNVTNGNESIEQPIDFLTVTPQLYIAALELSNAENKSVSMVNIANITISEDNKTLTLQVTPLPFYEGVALSESAHMSIPFDQLSDKKFTETRIIGEIPMDTPSNEYVKFICDDCMFQCSFRNDYRHCKEQCQPECT